ncbi:MAG: glycosyltransferase family 4 protein [Flavobacteriaceae bacterium]|nr:glycosyltransferase family 4 protein [Flavobacteriaceae bacterium]
MNKNLLIIGFVWPEPKSSAAGSRMMQLINIFRSHHYTITFASPCAKSDNAFDLESIDISQVNIELNNSSFDDFIKQLQPSIVLFDRFMMEEQFGWRVAEYCPNAIRILDTEDLHCLRKGRQQAFIDEKPFDISYLFNDIAKREIASIYRCDLSLIISEAEIDILKNKFKIDESLLQYLPFMLDEISSESINSLPKFKDRQHFISIGNFLHEPNYNSVGYLKTTIWPLIRQQLPKAELHVYGAYASQKVNQLHNKKEGFLIKGFAKDVNHVMQQVKVCVAPLQFGAGLKGKLVDAMINGTPSVTTTIGAEGMYGKLNPNGYVTDNPQIFANKAIELYRNKVIWQEKQQNGFQIINTRFTKTKFEANFLKIIEKLQHQLKQHRLQNFTGAMLQHHTLQSTKFMSKWIEEKNKTS